MRIKLTKSAIDKIAAPAKGRITVHDTATPGLCVRITSNNARTFYTCRWHGGRVLWVRLGDVAEMSVDAAQRMAREKNSDIRADVNPNLEKRKASEAATLRDMWTTYRAKVTKSPRTMIEDAGLWSRYLEPWSRRRIVDITSEAVQLLYNRIANGEINRTTLDRFGHERSIKGGPSAARHAVKLLREMFNATRKTFGIKELPTEDVRQNPDVSCERYLSADELPLFWQALELQDELIRDTLKLALYTAQRRANLLAMQWPHINFNFKTWTIPATEMKSGKIHTVPLPGQVMAILARRRKADPNGQWVLANPESDTGHLVNPEKAIARIWKAAGIPAFSLHDLRRTAATWLNSVGASESIIAGVLAHKHRNVTGVYAKATSDAMRQALQAAADAIEAAATGKLREEQFAKGVVLAG